MLLLTSPNDRLQIITSAAAIVHAHASWVDTDTGAGTIAPGRTNTAVSAAATTSVAGAPNAGVQRNVRTLHIRNADATLSCDVTVQHTDGTVVAQLYKRTLGANDTLEYTDQNGFVWTTASGSGGGTGGGGAAAPTTGDIRPTWKTVPDTGWIIANDGSIGNAASGATNRANADTAALFALLYSNIQTTVAPPRTCTISIASPAVITLASHGFVVNQQVIFSTTGALPTGLTAGAVYYVISAGLGASAFQVSTTQGGGAINTTGTQSGVHSVAGYAGLTLQDSTGATVVRGASAAADYAANRRLLLPPMAGRVLAAAGAGGGLAIHALGDALGAETISQTVAQMARHVHDHMNGYGENLGALSGYYAGHYELQNIQYQGEHGAMGLAIQYAGGGAPMNIIQPTTYVNYMIKL
jgi:hypothetical protein